MKIKTIVCDMDGTLYDGFSWDNILASYGLNEENKELFKKYYPQKHLTKEWAEKQASLLKGKKVNDGLAKLLPINYTKGAREFFLGLDSNYLKIILTTGVNVISDRIKEELGFDFSHSNILNHKNKEFDGTCSYLVPLWEKDSKLKEISKIHKFNLDEACFIGDGYNDLPCFNIVKLPVVIKHPWTKNVEENVKRLGGCVIQDFRELEGIL